MPAPGPRALLPGLHMPSRSLLAAVVGTLLLHPAPAPCQQVTKDPPAKPTQPNASAAPPADASAAKAAAPDTTTLRRLADSVHTAVLDSIRKDLSDAAKKKAHEDSLNSCVTPRASDVPRRETHCRALVEVFADGNVKDVLGSGKGAASTSGALGLHYIGNQYEVTGIVNVVGTGDTVRKQFGAAVLAPATGSALNAASLVIRRPFRKWGDYTCAGDNYSLVCNAGLRLHADASTRLWATATRRVAVPATTTTTASGSATGSTTGSTTTAAPDTVDQVVATTEVPTWGVGLDLSYTFFREAITTSDGSTRPIYMVLDMGVMRRAVRGDITDSVVDSKTGARTAPLSNKLLGTGRRNFDGVEVGLSMIYDKIRTTFTYVRLNDEVPGLSRGQIVAAAEIRAAIASGLLRR